MAIFSGTRCGQKHSENEDHHGYWQLDGGGMLLAIADGVGSHAYGGSVARWFIENLPTHTASGSLFQIAESVHTAIREDFDDIEEFLESGASISMVLIQGNNAEILWAGDSPVFWSRRQPKIETTRVTSPHVHETGALTNWFSGDRNFAPQIESIDMASGDVLTLCSDGVIIDEASHAHVIFSEGLSQAYFDGLLDESVLALDSDDATIVCFQSD